MKKSEKKERNVNKFDVSHLSAVVLLADSYTTDWF